MSAVLIVVLATLATCQAACHGGVVPAGAKIIYQTTRVITQVGTENVICSYNQCRLLDLTIVRVDISGANWSCRSGGPGDFKVEINVGGGDTRNFTATLWATGKDTGRAGDPTDTSPRMWPCITESLYTKCP